MSQYSLSPLRNGNGTSSHSASPSISPAEEGFALMRALVQEHKTVITTLRKDFAAREVEYQGTIADLIKTIENVEQQNDDLRRDFATAKSIAEAAVAERNHLSAANRECFQRLRVSTSNATNAVQLAAAMYSEWYHCAEQCHEWALEATIEAARAALTEQTLKRKAASSPAKAMSETAHGSTPRLLSPTRTRADVKFGDKPNILTVLGQTRDRSPQADRQDEGEASTAAVAAVKRSPKAINKAPAPALLTPYPAVTVLSPPAEPSLAAPPQLSIELHREATLNPEDVVLFIHTSAVELSEAAKSLHKGSPGEQQNVVELVRQQLLRCAEAFCAATALVKAAPLQVAEERDSVDLELLLDDWVADVARPLVNCLEIIKRASAAEGERQIRRALYRLSQVAEAKRLVLQSGAMNRAKQAAVALLASGVQSPTSHPGSFGDSEIPALTVSLESPTGVKPKKKGRTSRRAHFSASTNVDPTSTMRSDTTDVPDALLTTSEIFEGAGESSDDDVLYVEDDFSFRGSRVAMLTKAQRKVQGAVQAFRYLGSELEGMDMENVLRMTMTADTTVKLHPEPSSEHEE